MSKFLASAYKEMLLVSRDIGGLVILFLMPLVLVVTVTLLQDGAFRNITEQKTPILLIDNDGGEIGQQICMSLEESSFFSVISQLEGTSLTEGKAKELVRKGDYLLAVVLPAHLTTNLKENVSARVSAILNAFMEENKQASPNTFSTKEIRLYFDPTLSHSFKENIKSNIDKMMYQIENQFIYLALEKELPQGQELPKEGALVSFVEINPTEVVQIPNSVQHNVPAWALFAIFFITIPLSANIVREKSQGTRIRLFTAPLSYGELLMPKIIVFLCISLLQFFLMVLMGLYLFPLLGLPVLDISGRISSLLLIATASGLAAIGLGVLLGTLCRTQEQSAPLGATLTVILAAIGGVWIPVFAMPTVMQQLALLSPMNWALQAFYDVLLRGETFLSVLSRVGALCVFFILCISISILYGKAKRNL